MRSVACTDNLLASYKLGFHGGCSPETQAALAGEGPEPVAGTKGGVTPVGKAGT